MIEGWKDISSYISRATGRDISVDAIKKRVESDKDFARIVVTIGGRRPGISRFDLDRWITLSSARGKIKKKTKKNNQTWVQPWLALFDDSRFAR